MAYPSNDLERFIFGQPFARPDEDEDKWTATQTVNWAGNPVHRIQIHNATDDELTYTVGGVDWHIPAGLTDTWVAATKADGVTSVTVTMGGTGAFYVRAWR